MHRVDGLTSDSFEFAAGQTTSTVDEHRHKRPKLEPAAGRSVNTPDSTDSESDQDSLFQGDTAVPADLPIHTGEGSESWHRAAQLLQGHRHRTARPGVCRCLTLACFPFTRAAAPEAFGPPGGAAAAVQGMQGTVL